MDRETCIIFILTLGLILFVLFYNILIWSEEKILFYPTRKMTYKPNISYDNLYINSYDVNDVCRGEKSEKYKDPRYSYVNAWHFNNFKGRKTVIFCHGNSGNISHRKYIIDICQQFKLNLIIFDYRGFGKSSGIPSKDNVKNDGETVYKYLRQYEKPKNIIVWGESLGGIAAVRIASKYKCRSLILLSTFSGLDDAIIYTQEKDSAKRSMARLVAYMASWKLDVLPSRDVIKHVKCPVAIMHSKDDDMIPYKCAKILYRNVTHYSRVLIPIKGTHSSPIITQEQLNQLFMFCDLALPEYRHKCDIDGLLKELETVAEKHHLFMDEISSSNSNSYY